MNKQLFFTAVLCLLYAAFSSCSNDGSFDSSVNLSNEQVMAPVTVTTTGFGISQGGFAGTRATAVGDYSKVKFLTLAFYASDGTEVYKHTQVRDDNTTYTTFGEFTTSLMYGSYTMVVIANAGSNAITLTSPTVATYGENTALDTWVYTQVVNITSNAAVNLSATLDRIATAVTVQSTDNRPAEVTHMRLTCSAGGKGFNPTTGFATSNTGVSVTMAFAAETVGGTTYYGGYLFLATDEQTMDVTIETLDAEDGNVLFSKTVENVSLKRNRRTKLTGAIYSGTGVSASGFQVNTEWITDHNMGF
jgi:DMSO reductase anchor subunit